jgi:hypothetical protein
VVIAVLAWTKKISEIFPKSTPKAQPTDAVVISASLADSGAVKKLSDSVDVLSAHTQESINVARLSIAEAKLLTDATHEGNGLLRQLLAEMRRSK